MCRVAFWDQRVQPYRHERRLELYGGLLAVGTVNLNTGDIVVALIDDEEATLKRFRRRGASIALEPANTAYEVRILPPNRVRIQGKLVGLFRRY